MTNASIWRMLAALITAAFATAVAASIVQTQINLAALVAMGRPVPIAARIETTLVDMARFGPVMMAIAGVALVPALLAARILGRLVIARGRVVLTALAGFVALLVAFQIMGWFTPMPALVMAVRGTAGLLLMSLTGALGGLVFDRILRGPVLRTRSYAGIVGVVLALPAASFALTMPQAAAPVAPIDPETYEVRTLAAGLDRPWAIAILPDGRLLVTEKPGHLRVIAPDGAIGAIDLDMLPPIHTGGENGLLDVVPAPDFASSGTLYLTMTYGRDGAVGTRLGRARLVGDALTEVRILFSSAPGSSDSNKGGRLVLLSDGTLVLSIGDGNDTREQAQNPDSALGKLIRVDRNGRVPPDNPFAHRAGVAAAIFSAGHRHAQGLAVDPADGSLLISDHGPRGGDEIGRITPGGNHGWPIATEGIDYSFARVTPFRQVPGYEPPLHIWTPSAAPAGLAIYDGTMFPEWRGALLVPMLRGRSIRILERRGGRITSERSLLAERDQRIRDVKVAPDGAILVLTDGQEAELLRLARAEAPKLRSAIVRAGKSSCHARFPFCASPGIGAALPMTQPR